MDEAIESVIIDQRLTEQLLSFDGVSVNLSVGARVRLNRQGTTPWVWERVVAAMAQAEAKRTRRDVALAQINAALGIAIPAGDERLGAWIPVEELEKIAAAVAPPGPAV